MPEKVQGFPFNHVKILIVSQEQQATFVRLLLHIKVPLLFDKTPPLLRLHLTSRSGICMTPVSGRQSEEEAHTSPLRDRQQRFSALLLSEKIKRRIGLKEWRPRWDFTPSFTYVSVGVFPLFRSAVSFAQAEPFLTRLFSFITLSFPYPSSSLSSHSLCSSSERVSPSPSSPA